MNIGVCEWVSPGHSDRTADCLAAKVIEDIMAKDGFGGHAAIEVFLMHDTVVFSGEAKTTLRINKGYLKKVVKDVFRDCGYGHELRRFWDKKHVTLAKDLKIINKIYAQSPDIARATTDQTEECGFNDQGVMFSSSQKKTETSEHGLGDTMTLATKIGEYLFKRSMLVNYNNSLEGYPHTIHYGPDIKVLVAGEMNDDGFTLKKVTRVTIAVPHQEQAPLDEVQEDVRRRIVSKFGESYNGFEGCEWTINGTGKFTVFGCISDTSMTGRKISVNHPSAGPVWCNKMIGGGSLVKPYNHASDFLLNVAARFVANIVVSAGYSDYAVVGVGCAIGQKHLESIDIHGDPSFELKKNSLIKKAVEHYFMYEWEWSPKGIYDKLKLGCPSFSYYFCVLNNFFGHPTFQPWDNHDLIDKEARALKEFVDLVDLNV